MARKPAFVSALKKAVKILGGQGAASRATGIPQPTIHRWLHGPTRRYPLDAPFKFETATKRQVKATEFFG